MHHQHAKSLEEASIQTTIIPLVEDQAGKNTHDSSGFGTLDDKGIPYFRRGSCPTSSSATIALSNQEEQLFHTLVSAADAYERGVIHIPGKNGQQQPPRVEIRVAGGWVRDKLLKLHSHDVDIAVDTMSGVDFATIVQTYVQRQQQQLQSNDANKDNKKRNTGTVCGRMGVIAANPSQSKHLETATMMLHQIEVDFTNLRSEEVYEAHSRIPTTSFGTPLEDAERRDFTINALYFNLRSRTVEDWTKRGLQDLHKGLMVTPLEPMTTFHDDPLRVLRAIRFAVRYNFQLHTELQQACMSESVHQSLHVKVSRERVGKELEGMLSGKGAQPPKALDTIAHLKLSGSVFLCPVQNVTLHGTIMGAAYVGTHETTVSHLRELGWEEARRLLHLLGPLREAFLASTSSATLAASTNAVSSGKQPRSNTTLNDRILHIATFLSPFRHLHYTDHKGRDHNVVTYMIREGIKFKNKDVNAINTLIDHVDRMKSFLSGIVIDNPNSFDSTDTGGSAGGSAGAIKVCRLEAGLLIRQTKDLWITCLFMATVLKLRELEMTAAPTTPTATTTPGQEEEGSETQKRQQHLIAFVIRLYHQIMDMGLDRYWEQKHLMDGRAIIQRLGVPRGPIVQTYLDEQIRWMLVNPQGSIEECEVHLRNCKRELEQNDDGDGDSSPQNGTNANGGGIGNIVLGVSDGAGPSSPVLASHSGKHMSKKMHVESMDLT